MLIPVLEDALDRSLVLAAAMDSRGYGRRADRAADARMITSVLVLAGVVGVCVGTYGVLDGTTPRALGGPMLAAGCVVAVIGIRVGGRRVRRSVYRPDPWGAAEWMVVACGVAAAAAMFVASSVDPDNLYPTLQPLRWPTLGLLPAIGALDRRAAGRAGAARTASPRRPASRERLRWRRDRVRCRHGHVPARCDCRRFATSRCTSPEGEMCLVVGRTGVGKSTLLGAINGLVPHFTGGELSGRVTVAGLDTRTHPPRELAGVVGVVMQDPVNGFVTDTVEEELAYGMEQLAIPAAVMRKRVEETLDLLGHRRPASTVGAIAVGWPAATGRDRRRS